MTGKNRFGTSLSAIKTYPTCNKSFPNNQRRIELEHWREIG